MKRLLSIALLLAVAGCAGKPHVEFPKPPADKLVCPDEPDAPEGEITDEKNGKYLTSLRRSWAGCREDVDWLRAWFKALNAK